MSYSDEEISLEDDQFASSAVVCSDFARKLWLSASTSSDMQLVESLYCKALQLETSNKSDYCESSAKRRRRKLTQASNITSIPLSVVSQLIWKVPLTEMEHLQTAEKYSLLLCQSGRAELASSLLSSLGFTCRLSSSILNYPDDTDTVVTEVATDVQPPTQHVTDPCIILDNFLNVSTLSHLKKILQDIDSSYWTSHDYKIEPPSPYFSYVLPIQSSISETHLLEPYGFLGQLISQIYHSPILRSHFPALKEATKVEMWAHNRPHPSGHQFHFDSDNEGRGGIIRNPIVSTVLYITAENGCGGPSIVTNQTLKDKRLATRGWMCYPKVGRLVAFDGKVLHGVVPGKGIRPGRRVTLMFAFWKDIRIRNGEGSGAARPFPLLDSTSSKDVSWIQEFLLPMSIEERTDSDKIMHTQPYLLDHIYETLDGNKWSTDMGFPQYDQVFQGF